MFNGFRIWLKASNFFWLLIRIFSIAIIANEEVMKKLLIVGAGFAGFWGAMSAVREMKSQGEMDKLSVTLVAKEPFHTIKPRLYEENLEGVQVALKKYCEPLGIKLVIGEVISIDPDSNKVSLANIEEPLSYDVLLYAAGSQLNANVLLDNKNSFNIDTFNNATLLNDHLALLGTSGFPTEASKSIVVIGAGFTGLELTTSLRNRFKESSKQASPIKIHLVDKSEILASNYSGQAQEYIAQCLSEEDDVELHLGDEVKSYENSSLLLSSGEVIETETVIWTVGVKANKLTDFFNGDVDNIGRIHVDEFLRLKDYPNVFVAGDVAKAKVDPDNYALMSCQHAMPQGKFAGHNAVCTLFSGEMKSYAQPKYLTCIDLGGSNALFTSGWERSVQMTGSDAKELKTNITTQWIYPAADVSETLKMSFPELIE